MKTLPLVMFATCLLFSGCATSMVTDLTSVQAKTPLTDAPRLPVRCAPNIPLHEDQTDAMGLPMRWATGKVFATHFYGGEEAEASIELLSSNLRYNIADLGFTAAFRYSAELLLRTHGERHVLHAEAERNTHGFEMPPTTVKIVVETVVADLSRQVAALTK